MSYILIGFCACGQALTVVQTRFFSETLVLGNPPDHTYVRGGLWDFKYFCELVISMKTGMPWTVRIVLLHATVRGAVGHGMEIWLSSPSLLLRQAEAKMMRRIFGCPRRATASALYWLTKSLPIDTMAQARSLKLAAKILDMELEEGEPALELLALKGLIKSSRNSRQYYRN